MLARVGCSIGRPLTSLHLHPGPSPHEVSMLRFDVVLKDIVVMPGQAFELAFTGGPTKNERTYFDYVSSAPDVVSVDLGICLTV